MTEQSIRQNYLRLISKLYELASQFSREELRAVRGFARGENNRAVETAVAFLLDLHGGNAKSFVEKPAQADISFKSSPNLSRRRERALREILVSKELFRSTSELAKSIPGGLAVKPKESREKYANRVLSHFRNMSVEEQERFMREIQDYLAVHSTGSFVSRWSKLIKDL